VVTCEIELFQKYFNLPRPSEIILPEIISEDYCSSVFQHIRCRWSNILKISAAGYTWN